MRRKKGVNLELKGVVFIKYILLKSEIVKSN